MTPIALSRLHFPVTTLGPGRRIGVWFQGCSIRCPGCISRDTWDTQTGQTSVEEVLTALKPWVLTAEGLTVSGGEPLDQPQALEELLSAWRRMSGTSVLLFTGYEFPLAEPWLKRHPDLVDAVVAGPYRQEAGQTLALRGSDNQTLHILSARGVEFAVYEGPLAGQERRLDVMFDASGQAWFAGIPAPDMLPQLRHLLGESGHEARTSDEKPGSPLSQLP